MISHVVFALGILVVVLIALSRLLRSEVVDPESTSEDDADEAEARRREQEMLEAERILAEERRLEQIRQAEDYEFVPLAYRDVPKASPAEDFLWMSEVTQIVDNVVDANSSIVETYKGKLVFTNQRIFFDAENSFVDFKLSEIRRVKNDTEALSFLLQDGHILKFENIDITLRIILNRILEMTGYA